MYKTAILFTLVCLTAASTASGQVSELKDSDRMRGSWSVASFRMGDAIVPLDDLGELSVMIGEETITTRNGDQDPITVKYKLDSTKSPKQIDLIIELDPDRPITQLGIYQLEDDKLTLCIASAGQARPDKFSSPTANVMELKRSE